MPQPTDVQAEDRGGHQPDLGPLPTSQAVTNLADPADRAHHVRGALECAGVRHVAIANVRQMRMDCNKSPRTVERSWAYPSAQTHPGTTSAPSTTSSPSCARAAAGDQLAPAAPRGHLRRPGPSQCRGPGRHRPGEGTGRAPVDHLPQPRRARAARRRRPLPPRATGPPPTTWPPARTAISSASTAARPSRRRTSSFVSLADRAQKEFGFTIDPHHFSIFGRCRNCQ